MKHKVVAEPGIRDQFAQAGFEIAESGASSESITVRKHNCVHDLELQPDHSWKVLGPPRFIIRGVTCRLEDCGYQKFWRDQDTRFPVRKAELEALHRFDEEVREILRLRTLYNESLGSTCTETIYDRLGGRPDR